MKAQKRPKLTLKAAKAIALKEIGTAKGLTACEGNNDYWQGFSMIIGNIQITISNSTIYAGIVRLSFGGKDTYYDINTLEENFKVLDDAQRTDRLEMIRGAATCQAGYMFKALLEEYGFEECRRMLDEAARKLKSE